MNFKLIQIMKRNIYLYLLHVVSCLQDVRIFWI